LGHSFRGHSSKQLRRVSNRRGVLISLFLAIALVTLSLIAARTIEPAPRQTLRASDNSWQQNDVRRDLAVLAGQVAAGNAFATSRPVYRYSVVPGGVRSGEELRLAAKRDRAVAHHYAAFNFDRARITELGAPRFIYMSYRRGDRIFWTHKQMALPKGEKLITDGKITARTRCANQISVLPHAETSLEEPMAQEFEDPFDEGGSATRFDFPGNFETALLNRPAAHGFGAEGPPLPGTGPLFGPSGGGFPGIFPPVISDSCEPMPKPKPKGGVLATTEDESSTKKKKKKTACSPTPNPPPTAVPEPGSILLVSSGIAGIYARRDWRKRCA
jgi:PEP-CTERM motif